MLLFVLFARVAALGLEIVPTQPDGAGGLGFLVAFAVLALVRKMPSLPIGRQALLAIALPAAIPMLGVVAIEVPVRELLLKVLSTLA